MMDLTPMDAALWALSVVGQLVVLIVLVRRRLYRIFPIFFGYLIFCSICDIGYALMARHLSERGYLLAYFANNVPEFLFEVGVLFEVARNVINPVRRSLPRAALYLFGAMLVIVPLVTLVLSAHAPPAEVDRWSQYFVQIHFAVAILRLAIFAAIASFSQMLGIGWGNHVLQIATGFLGYSIVVLLVELMHRATGVGNDAVFHAGEQFRTLGWCIALGYWSYVLVGKEATRKEFNPKMASFLVSIAQASSSNRAASGRWYRK